MNSYDFSLNEFVVLNDRMDWLKHQEKVVLENQAVEVTIDNDHIDDRIDRMESLLLYS